MKGDAVAAAVIVAFAAVILALAVGIADEQGASDVNMLYDDYTVIPDAQSVSGCLELRTVDGTQYVHATDIGSGSISTGDGTLSVRVSPAPLEVVMVMGQSNMAYYNAVASEVDTVPKIGTSYYFGSSSTIPYTVPFDPVTNDGIYDMIDQDGTLKVGDKGPTYCAIVSERTGHKVLWLSLGVPGRAIDQWAVGGQMWTHNVAMMNAAVNALDSFGNKFDVVETYALWGQGGHDYLYNTGYQHYIDTFNGIYSRIMAGDLSLTPEAIYMMPTRALQGGWVVDAQAELAQALPKLYDATGTIPDTFTIENGYLVSNDNIHFTQKGDNVIAEVFADYILKSRGVDIDGRTYLVASLVDADLDEAVAAPGTATAYRTDGTVAQGVPVSWDSAPDTASYGVETITGTASSEDLIPSAPVCLTVRVGYLGELNGLEYIRNSTGCAVMQHDPDLTAIEVPSEAFGLDVTELKDWSCYRGPWETVTIPDSVTKIGVRALKECPITTELNMGSGIQSIRGNALTWTLVDDGVTLAVNDWMNDPSLLAGTWTGTGNNTLTKVTP